MRIWHLAEMPSHGPLLTRHIPAVPLPPPAPAQGSWELQRREALCGLVEPCLQRPCPPGHLAGSASPVQPPRASGTGTEPRSGGHRAWPPVPIQPQTSASVSASSHHGVQWAPPMCALQVRPQLTSGGLEMGEIRACLAGTDSPVGDIDVDRTVTVQCDECQGEGKPQGRKGYFHLGSQGGLHGSSGP